MLNDSQQACLREKLRDILESLETTHKHYYNLDNIVRLLGEIK